MAMKFYEKNDYYKASMLFESISAMAVGRPEMENVKFYYAYCNFHDKAYLMSQFYFNEFAETFPRSNNTEEALFKAAESSYKMSPRYSLDQENSIMAVRSLENFLLKYPFSKFKDQAESIIFELEAKMELKAYLNAKEYFKIREFRAAVLAFTNFNLEYPTSKYREEIFYLRVQAQYELALISLEEVIKDDEIIELKKDRFAEVKVFYHDFIDTYPESEYLREAENIYNSTIVQLHKKKKRKWL
jgi:outer membrane protein assembly factor BamD